MGYTAVSYSRFIDSTWYTYPTADYKVACWRVGGELFYWDKEESLEEFLARVRESIEQDDRTAADIKELEEILCENIDDIKAHFAEGIEAAKKYESK